MPTVKFTSALKRFFPKLTDTELSANNVSDVVQSLEKAYPGIEGYLLDEQGALRKHVNIFVDGQLIEDRENLSDSIIHSKEILIFQALSGG